MEKYRLDLIVALVIFVIGTWLILTLGFGSAVAHLLLGVAVALFIWALLGGKETASFNAFLVKSFVISYVITSVIFFVSLRGLALKYIAYLGTWLVFIVFPRSLLPVAISVVIYGIFRARLSSWKILLSSWYVFIFAVQAAYSVWWIVAIQPYLHDFYQSGAGGIALDMFLVFVAFLVAGVFTVAYVAVVRPRETGDWEPKVA